MAETAGVESVERPENDEEGVETMWMKLIGCGLVITSSGALGIRKAEQWKEHRRTLERLRRMILLLKGEILYAHAPLGEALARVAGKSEEGVLPGLFTRVAERLERQEGTRFFDIWREEIDASAKTLILSEKEIQELKELGEHLGYLDLELQERTIALYLEQLDMAVMFYREHENEQTKLCTSLGVMGGLFLAIVMW